MIIILTRYGHFGFGLMIAIFAFFGIVLFFVFVMALSPIIKNDGIVAAIAFLVFFVYLIGVMIVFTLEFMKITPPAPLRKEAEIDSSP